MASWAGEISLDVEWAHAIAPKANIVLLLAKSDADPDILSAQQYAIDNRLGDVISQSFGENESCADPTIVTQTHQAFVQATLKNITLFASSGDDGAAQLTCDGTSFVKAVSHPAVDPLVTAVGATKLLAAPYCLASAGCNPAKNPPPGTYEGEVVWNDQFGSSGGGYSLLYKEPFFQLGSVQGGKRGVPDVSYNGAVTSGVLVYLDTPGLQAGFYIFGGTSAGSPQWAALLAISDQRAGYDVGFINQGLYLLRDNRALYKDSFFDITSGNNTFDGASGFNAAPGWDPTTGLGSPNGIDFVDHLLQSVSPLDGLIGITEAGPLTGAFKSGLGRQRPH
jgi:subtilase family serine protease